GTIPSELADLPKLEFLFLSYNQLTGAIPARLANLRNLLVLDLAWNQLEGSIPPELGALPNLEELLLDGNFLRGAIPGALGELPKLRTLRLSYNELEGPLPSQLGQLSNLEELELEFNRLTGTIPATLFGLQKLRELFLGFNDLEGAIPKEMQQLTALTELSLGANRFSGLIPPELANLRELRLLALYHNELTGTIPVVLSTLENLETLELQENQLTGGIPPELSRLTNLTWLDLSANQLTGTIPEELEALTNLRELHLYGCQLEGTIPALVTKLPHLEGLLLSNNRLTGVIPPDLTQVTPLTYLALGGNQLTGTIPTEIGNLVNLQYLGLDWNQLTGPIPPSIERLTNLVDLQLQNNALTGDLPTGFGTFTNLLLLNVGYNELTGTIPAELGQLAALQYLGLGGNRFRGAIPKELGNLTELLQFDLSQNQIRGAIPAELMKLTNLENEGSDLGYNALYTNDIQLRSFLNQKLYEGWEETQTIAPTNEGTSAITDRSVVVSWRPIAYSWDGGGYQVSVHSTPGGPSSAVFTTATKEDMSIIVRGLQASTTYHFEIRTVSHPQGYQQNVVVSDPVVGLSATTLPRVVAPPEIDITTSPNGLVQVGGAPRNEDSYMLTNFGDIATTITLEKSNGDFFNHTPTTFTLPGGSSQRVTITSVANQPIGYHEGYSVPTGTGVPEEFGVTIRLLSVAAPMGSVVAEPLTSRIDIVAERNADAIGTVGFRNVGTATLTGILVADVPWIAPPTDVITIPPQESRNLSFNIVGSKRPATAQLDGTLTGSLNLIYLDGSAAGKLSALASYDPANNHTSGISTSTVTVVHTTKPATTTGAIPPLAAGEIARFIPGVASLLRGTSPIVSDVSIANSFGTRSVSDLKIYFTAAGATTSSLTDVGSIAPNQSVTLANVVRSVAGSTSQVGTLQLRTTAPTSILAAARLLNLGSPAGSFGDTIPIFRSDRSAAPGAQIVLTGVRKSATTGTTLYLQETTGLAATATIDFLDAAGGKVGSSQTETLAAFALTEVLDAVPERAVTVIVTNSEESAGRIAAHAQVIDNASGDSWALAEWPAFFGYPRDAAVKI
ncbi:MAG TPA: leucine-rich repeat domain-containing protein, partial [Thermoanaerobaculia bacterium]